MSRQQPARRGAEQAAFPTMRCLEAGNRSSISWALRHIKGILMIFVPSFIRNIVSDPTRNDSLPKTHKDGAASTEKDPNQRYAHLDGLRGLAALSVFVLHLFSPFDMTLGSGYGPEPSTRTIFNLPIIRLVHAGQAMVKVFFVVSGFVLTTKPAKYIVSPQVESTISPAQQLHQHLGASILKRGIRLFLPPVVTTFCAMCLAYAGAFLTAEEIIQLPTGLIYLGIARRQTFSLQVLDWARFVACKLTNPWGWLDSGWHLGYLESTEDFSIYGPHLWTVQTEFRCSIALFSVLMAVSRIPRRRLRELFSVSIIVYCAAWARWDVALFISGMLCCLVSTRQHVTLREESVDSRDHITSGIEAPEVSIAHTSNRISDIQFDSSDVEAAGDVSHERPVASAHVLNSPWWQLPLRPRKPPRQRRFAQLNPRPQSALNSFILSRILRHLLLWVALLASLWLLSYPERMIPGALGFEYLRQVRADHEFWQFAGAVLLISVIGKITLIRYILTSSIVQYVGKISFAFYLVHVPVLESVGWRMANAWWVAVERLQDGERSGNTTVTLGSGVLSVAVHALIFSYVFFIITYFADLAWMYVDLPTLRLLRMLELSLGI